MLGTRRKPFQDSPTPAGNSVASIDLTRLYEYTNDSSYREKAQQTLEILAGVAGQYGLFAATYGIAAVHFSQPHIQVVILEEENSGNELRRAAIESFGLNKAVISMDHSKAVAPNLPPALAATIPNLPPSHGTKSVAIVCSGFTCLPSISGVEELRRVIAQQVRVQG